MSGPADRFNIGEQLKTQIIEDFRTDGVAADGQVVDGQDIGSMITSNPPTNIISLNDQYGNLYIMCGYKIASCVIHPGRREEGASNSEESMGYEEI